MLLVSFSLDDVSEAFRGVLRAKADRLDALSQLAYIHEERATGDEPAPCEKRNED